MLFFLFTSLFVNSTECGHEICAPLDEFAVNPVDAVYIFYHKIILISVLVKVGFHV